MGEERDMGASAEAGHGLEHAFKSGFSIGTEWGKRDSSQSQGETYEQAKCDAWQAYEVLATTKHTPEAARAESNAGVREAIAASVAEVMAEGDGHWSPCTGCQESVDGCVSSTDYPYDPVFQCRPGGGCGECGGIGVTWTPSGFYDGIVEWSQEQDRTRANVLAALDKLVVINGEIIGKQTAADAILALSPQTISEAVDAEREACELQATPSQPTGGR